jgi:hypothetical protein
MCTLRTPLFVLTELKVTQILDSLSPTVCPYKTSVRYLVVVISLHLLLLVCVHHILRHLALTLLTVT